MKLAKTTRFVKRFKKLPPDIQKKVTKQIGFLEIDFFHPSLNTKKMGGYPNKWEFRVSKGYRMAGKKVDDTIVLSTVGQHDVGLGKK